MKRPWDAFSKLRIDNNHPLNTLLIYWLGEQANWIVYRLPALLSGVATVFLMGAAARLLDTKPWLAMLLATVSLPLIQYSAEARGYSTAALLGLTAWYICYAHLAMRISPGWLLAFWACCILGMLSHMTFIFVLAALGLALVWGLALDRQAWLDATARGGDHIHCSAGFYRVVVLVFLRPDERRGRSAQLEAVTQPAGTGPRNSRCTRLRRC